MKFLPWLITLVLFTGCSGNHQKSDAYGNFEAIEVTISAEASGKILRLDAEAGQVFEAGAVVGQIDPTDLAFRSAQLLAQREAAASKIANIQAQIDVQVQQQQNLLADKARIEKLLQDGAATTKQLDDVNAGLNLMEKQILATKIQNNSVKKELAVYDRQIEQIEDNIRKCRVLNPIAGTILNKYAEAGEITAYGKALYNIANLSEMDLRVYVSGDQLPDVRLGDKVEILSTGIRKPIVPWKARSAGFRRMPNSRPR